jgi:hypothetical protein
VASAAQLPTVCVPVSMSVERPAFSSRLLPSEPISATCPSLFGRRPRRSCPAAASCRPGSSILFTTRMHETLNENLVHGDEQKLCNKRHLLLPQPLLVPPVPRVEHHDIGALPPRRPRVHGGQLERGLHPPRRPAAPPDQVRRAEVLHGAVVVAEPVREEAPVLGDGVPVLLVHR